MQGFIFCAKEKSLKPLTPRVLAILIADKVYEDKSTQKKIVAGIFDQLWFADPEELQHAIEKEQAKHQGRRIAGGGAAGSPSCYLRLTDIRNTQSFVLRYVYLNEDEVLFQTQFEITCSDPLVATDVVVALPPLPTNRAGVFALELVWENTVIGLYRILVTKLPLNREDK